MLENYNFPFWLLDFLWNYFTAFMGQCTDLRAHVFSALLHFFFSFYARSHMQAHACTNSSG